MLRSHLRPLYDERVSEAGAAESELTLGRLDKGTQGSIASGGSGSDANEDSRIHCDTVTQSATCKETQLLFPDAYPPAFEPKVQVPFENVRGRIPRRIEVERRRRRYESLSVEELLRISGLSLDDVAKKSSRMLPIEVFDDTTFDVRNPSEWMAIARGNPNPNGRFLPAEGLFEDPVGGAVSLRPCCVVDWDEERNEVSVVWDSRCMDDGHGAGKWHDAARIARIYVRLLAEDPIAYAKRVVSAHAQRSKATAWIRYRLCCDAMPTEGVPVMDASMSQRITRAGTDIPLFSKASFPSVEKSAKTLLSELHLEWQRAHNRILLRSRMTSSEPLQQMVKQSTGMDIAEIRAGANVAVAIGEESRANAIIPCTNAQFDFTSHERAFKFATYFTQKEAVFALTGVRSECLNVLDDSLFELSRARQLSLDTFVKLQKDHMQKVTEYLKGPWMEQVCAVIRTSFDNSGKGWLNIYEPNQDIYEMSKLKRFFITVKYMMEDTLFDLVYTSLSRFATFFEDVSMFTVVVEDMNNVHNSWPGSDADDAVEKQPLFTIDLTESEKGFAYSVPFDVFERTIIDLFDSAIQCTYAIPQVEKYVMNQYFWKRDGDGPFLESVRRNEDRVCDLRERVRTALRSSLKPLQDYLSAYDELLPLVHLDKQQFVQQYETTQATVDELREDIKKHLKAKRVLANSMPSFITVGNYIINCQSFCYSMASREQELATLIMNTMNNFCKTKGAHVIEEFAKIARRVEKHPQSAEKLYQLKNYIANLGDQLQELNGNIDEMHERYAVLQNYQYDLTDPEFRTKWEAIGWPRRLEVRLDVVKKNLEKVEEELHTRLSKETEELGKRVDALQRIVATFSKHTNAVEADVVAAEVKTHNIDIKKCIEEARAINNDQRLFGDAITDYHNVFELEKEFKPYSDLWLMTHQWQDCCRRWNSDPFTSLDPEEIESVVEATSKTMTQLSKTFKDKHTMLKIVNEIQAYIEEFKPIVPIVTVLRHPGMKERHWKELSEKLGVPLVPGDTLALLSDCRQLLPHSEVIISHCEVAARESQIEKALKDMRAELESKAFVVEAYKETGTYILKDVTEVIEIVDEQLNTTQQLQFSPFKAFFEEAIADWDRNLNLISEIFEQWLECQRSWRYLEPIFSSEDIAVQLPRLAKLFEQVDKTWRRVMGNAKNQPQVLDFCLGTSKLLDQLRECNRLLEEVQHGLNDYLADKRQCFPRFYFLSDEELLAILSQAKEVRRIDENISKLFEFIDRMKWAEEAGSSNNSGNVNSNAMVGFYSVEDEYIPHKEAVLPEGNVEMWLRDVEGMMKDSVNEQLKLAVAAYKGTPRSKWVLQWPGQVVMAVSQLFWTSGCEEALERDGQVSKFYTVLEHQLDELVDVVQSPLNARERVNMGALITIEVHAKDTVENMIAQRVDNTSSFEWMKQLRFYFEQDELCHIRQVDAHFVYGGEYLGNTGRLVVTPLTDRIYLTLTGALALSLGGAPAGPAGTGKTETTKDLAKALAKQCVVLNCQEGMTYLSMAKLFKGLAWAGAWACLDEFNRIDVEVLSVVAQQVTDLQQACLTKQYRIVFEGSDIVVDPTHAVFITMNPGYAGRTELPDNLKVLFRPVACMVPDYAMIGEIRLFSYGYKKARNLAQKMVMTFKLSSEQLSSQDHYDFGMRAVNTVISAAGLNKRENPTGNEDELLLRALRDSNVPKFLQDDILLFQGIVSDLFPGIHLPSTDYGYVVDAVRGAAAKENLQSVPAFVEKCLQLYDITTLRHGLMLVGPTGSGKSSAYTCLQTALTECATRQANGEDMGQRTYMRVYTHVCNPKAVTMDQLYGAYDENGEWKDGVLCVLFRRAAKYGDEGNQNGKHWVVFDGPVDALWIESMNTVLDENKKLCLVSGEIIQMNRDMTMMFEVEDLAVASPATVSRCGMIYMEPTRCVPTTALVTSWTESMPRYMQSEAQTVAKLANTYIDPIVHLVRTALHEYITTSSIGLVQSCIRMFDGFIVALEPPKGSGAAAQPGSPEHAALLKTCVPPLFFMSLVWSVGASCDDKGREQLDKLIHELAEKHEHTSHLPLAGSLYDYCFTFPSGSDDAATVPQWVHWKDTMPPLKLRQRKAYDDITVPTIDNIRQNYVIRHLLTNKVNVAAVGPTGTGKSLSVGNMILSGLSEKYIGATFTFSAQTKGEVLQSSLISKLDKRRSHVYGAPVGKHFIVFIDDANLPQKERYGAQPPLELLRQLLGHGGCYNTVGGVKWNSIIDMSVALAMGPPGGGRNQVSSRLMRYFNFVSFPEMSDDSKQTILETIVHAGFHLASMKEELVECSSKLINGTISIFKKCCKEFLPTPAHVHYEFNMRDVIRVFGMIYTHSNPQSIPDKATLVRMWLHENERVFADRLVSESDRNQFRQFLETELTETLGYANGWKDVVGGERLLFGDYLSKASPPQYQQINDMNKLRKRFDELLAVYNTEHESKMNLVLFIDAIEHVSRIARVLGLPNGHCLLLGVGGSGRKSLTRLACSLLNGMEVFTVEMTKSFGVKEWHEALAKLLLGCGLEDKSTAFLFSDTQLTHPTFMEEVAALLTSGDVPNLFEDQDTERINEMYKGICLSENLPTSKVSMYSRFIKAVRSRLHIVLAFSPIGEAFRTRLRMFPALINCCTIDWFSSWPSEALVSVAEVQLLPESDAISAAAAGATAPSTEAKTPKEEAENAVAASVTAASGAEILSIVANCVKAFHLSASAMFERFFAETKRRSYVTPTSYLTLLQTFASMLSSKRLHIREQKTRLERGLEKLYDTEHRVADLEEQLRAQQPVLAAKKIEIKALMERLAVDREVAAEKETTARTEEAAATAKADECSQMRRECADHLAEAEPALQEAVKVLSKIKASEIGELNKYQNPPKGVQFVMEAVALLLTFGNCPKEFYSGQPGGKKTPDWWLCAKSYMKNANQLLEILVNPPEKGGFNRDAMTLPLMERVKVYYDNEEFQPEKVRSVSVPCMAMCQWVRAMYSWFFVNREIQPLREKLASAEEELGRVTEALAETRAKLAAVVEAVQILEKEYSDAVATQAALEAEMEKTTQKLSRASRLIDGLGGEKHRWIEQVTDYASQERHVVGDMLVAAASVAYFGPLTATFRRQLLAEWKETLTRSNVATGDAFDLVSTSGNPVTIQQWQLCGLPTDSLSTENALILANARSWPLLIDPQGQANAWIRKTHKNDNLQICRPSEPRYMKTIEGAVRLGLPCLLENVGSEIEPALEPVLLRNVFTIGSTPHIRIGDSAVPYDRNFRLYMTTKLPNPTYTPETTVMVSLLNFFITPGGLEEQLLEKTVEKERHDLESAKQQLTRDMAENNKELKALQDAILRMLEDVKGDILEEEDLITTLEMSKRKSIQISEDLAKARATEITIDETRNKYRPHAIRGSLLFFCAAELSTVDPMYQFSLQWFITLFLNGIDNAEHPDPELIGAGARRRSVGSSVTAAGSAVAAAVAAARRRMSSVAGAAPGSKRGSMEAHRRSTAAVRQGSLRHRSLDVLSEEEIAEELVKQRVLNLIDYFTYSFYSNVCRSLFEKHKLTFSMFLCTSIVSPEGKLDAAELRFLLTGPTGSGGALPNPAQSWLTENSWNEIQFLNEHVPTFAGFAGHVAKNIDHYKNLFDSGSAHRFPLAAEWEGKETPLQRLVVTRCFRKDKVVVAIQEFVKYYMGEAYVIVPQFNMADVYKDSSCLTPIIFIISPGSDPMNDLMKFAEDMHMTKKLDKVSLGQGQGKKAEELLAEGRDRGQWVLLQNCHLATSWMPMLEIIVESFSPETVKREFRLWLTSMPSSTFPTSVLQIAVKMTNEPPKGLRANVTRSYLGFKEEDLELEDKSADFKKVAFAMCLFHGVLQERRRFGSLGFNIAYEFNDSDRSVCLLQLRKFMGLYEHIPFDVLTFLSGEINYGGRVTDDWDRRCLMTMIKRFLCPEALEVGYAFSPSGVYETIAPGAKAYYLDYFDSWPLNPEPEVFGLHDNADITSAQNETQSLLTTMLALTARDGASSSGATSRDQLLTETATTVFQKLPQLFDIAELQQKYPTSYEESMNTVLVQEAVRYNRLLRYVRTSLADFIRAIRGEVGMSAELEAVGASLFMNAVPASWASWAYPSMKPLSSWADDLVKRVQFISAWGASGVPDAFWIGGFFFPQAFLTGTLQNYAREVQEPIDTISFSFHVLSSAPADASGVERPGKGAIVYGLFMDGARWDTETESITESRPKELFVSMPPIHFDPVINRPKPDNVYVCPVYKTLARAGTLSTTGHSTNFVLPIELNTTVSADHWVSRGVACVVSLNF